MMEKKILTREEQALDWLKSEIEKDKMELENNKKKHNKILLFIICRGS